MRIHLKKRFTALMLAGMMVTSNVLPAYSATDGIAVEQADASYEAEAASADASVDAENSEAGGCHLNRTMLRSAHLRVRQRKRRIPLRLAAQ